ncbi:MAG: hypothetical protein EON93_03280 [Burkholderiales bacterium]|nr:MAG: hypothetical protein EON93_03280 [Burkholderiales bacterium]
MRLVLGLGVLALSACSASNAESNVAIATETRVLEAPELMIHVIDPAARSFWKGYSEVLDENGWRDISPSSEAEWKRVEDGAATLMTGGHLLLQPEYTREPVADWNKLAKAFLDLASEGKAQAENQSKDAMLVLGEQLDESCDSCHAQFAPHVD